MSRILVLVGGIAMLVGALDPMEGAVVILPGSGLVALGSLVGQSDRRLLVFRVWVFILIALGVGAMWGLSMAGGLGGNSGRSIWWGVLILPYLIGWSIGIWGPGSPRWLLLAGMVVGLWYLVIMGIVLKGPVGHRGATSDLPAVVIGFIGALTIAGCLIALLRRRTRLAH
ncbi:MAG: hypothetical protein ACLQVX_21055 [Limisphaerales bacterium]